MLFWPCQGKLPEKRGVRPGGRLEPLGRFLFCLDVAEGCHSIGGGGPEVTSDLAARHLACDAQPPLPPGEKGGAGPAEGTISRASLR